MNLKPYPEYKNSGISWFGKIPKDWKVIRNKFLLHEINDKSESGKEELLTVSHYTGITKRKSHFNRETDIITTAKSLIGYKKVSKNNLVMNIMLAWNGSLGISPYEGIVSPAYCVFKVNDKTIFPKFLHYLHRTSKYTSIFKTVSTGVIESRLRLYPEEYFRLISCIPPLNEQLQITCFLDWKTSQIAKLIKTKKQMIELIKEQKQVIINDAVTGKINVATGKPYPKYKASGVEWLGQVPEEWEIKKIKYIAKMKSGENITSISINEIGEYPVYGGNGLRGYYSLLANPLGKYLIGTNNQYF